MIGTMAGNYKVLEKIGEGGMGSVYRGVDLMLEREVAIKVLRAELARQPEVVERFRTEAVTLAKLNHPNIAMLYSFFRQGDDFFMVMEFVRGETLESRIRRSGPLPLEAAVPLFCLAMEGIEHAHRLGIIHRDIKPANIMLTDTGSIKVMDFGIARMLGTARMTRQGSIVGTIEYMSPEQVRGEEADARSDIYSMGILLYEMLTGRVPFNSASEYELMKQHIEVPPPPPRSFAGHISPALETVILRSLAKDPRDRFQSAAEFRSALHDSVVVEPPRPMPGVPGSAFGSAAAESTSGGLIMPGSGQGAKAEDTPDARETRVPVSTDPWREVYGSPAAMKETRIPYTRQSGSAGSQDISGAAGITPGGFDFGQGGIGDLQIKNTSLFARLNWKYYAAAGVGLMVLLIVPLVVGTILLGNSPVKKNELTAPANSPSPAVGVPVDRQTESTPISTPTPIQAEPLPTTQGLDAGTAPASDTQGSDAAKRERLRKEAETRKEAEARDKARRRAAAERALDQ
ncbi:MAG TPA: serine/threonine-protein kinase [Blastocatellia bacterium]|nr:serine/threonine-protein kinase [Blastocatellia bacterium]